MLHSKPDVAAIALVDLATELKRHSIINIEQIQALHFPLCDYVLALEQQQDISELMDMRYPETLLIALWQLANQDGSDSDIGLRIGKTVSPQTQGLVSNLMLHCDNLREVLITYLANISLVNASETWVIRENNKQLEMSFNFTPGKPYPRCAVERSMVSFHRLGEYYCQQKIPLISVEFAFPKPEYHLQIQQQFNCEVSFDSAKNALHADKEVFSYVLPQRNRYIKNMLQKKIVSLSSMSNTRPIERKVRELLRSNMSYYCHLENLASSFHMSRTTLYRRLVNEGASFSKLLDEERQQMLKFHPNASVAVLCDLLGFQDPSAYYKACKRWRQVS